METLQRKKLVPSGKNLITRSFLLEFNAHTLSVPIFNSNAVAMSAHLAVKQIDLSVVQAAKQLADFFLQLLFFVLDEWHNISQDVERGYTGIPCTADRLHCADKQALNPEALLQRFEGQHQSNRAAIWIGDDIAATFFAPALRLDQGEMIRVHLGHHQRDVGHHAECARIRNNCASSSGKLRLQLPGNVCIERSEDNLRQLDG